MPPTRVTATFHPSSSVLSSVKCSLSSRDRQHLVVGKLDCLEVYSIQPDKLQLECKYQVTGKLRAVKAVPVTEHRSNLLVLLDHPDPATLFLSYTESFESDSARLVCIAREDLYERGGRAAEYCNDVLVHPNGRLAVVSCYTGRLKVIAIKNGEPEPSYYDVQIPELNILSFAFAPVQRHTDYVLTLLHLNHSDETHLVSRNLTVGSSGVDLSLEPSEHLKPALIPTNFIPFAGQNDMIPKLVPVNPQSESQFWGGILVIGGTEIMLYACSEPTSGAKRKRSEKEKAKEKKPSREYKKRKALCTVEWPWSDVTAVTSIDQDGQKVLVGDRFGRLAILSTVDLNKQGLILIPLGETSSPKTISYLDNQAVFIGSHFGDSQVVKIHPQSASNDTKSALEIPLSVRTVTKSTLDKDADRDIEESDGADEDGGFKKGRVIDAQGTYLTVLHTFKNIAPVLDAALVDVDNTGQSQIITCSGGGNTGSVNVVRMGADFDELASITGLENVTNVWPIRKSYLSSTHSHVIVSTLDATHVLRIDSGGETLTRVEAVNSFALDVPTICVRNMAKKEDTGYQDASFVVQVTETAVHLLEYDDQSEQWWERDALRYPAPPALSAPGSALTNVAADINPSQILLARSGGKLASFTIRGGKLTQVSEDTLFYWDGNKEDPNHVPQEDWRRTEISAVSVSPMKEDAFFTTFAAVAFWHTNQIKIYSYADSGFKYVSQSSTLPATVKSLLFYNFGTDHTTKGHNHRPHLVAGLSNGHVVTFSCLGKEKELKDMKIIPLGSNEISLAPYQVEERRTVVATGNKSGILEWDKSRLRHSPVMLKDINSVSAFNTNSYPGSLILTTYSSIHIGRIKDINKMHVRGVSLGLDIPRKIVHVPALKILGVATDRTEPARIGDDEVISGSFRLLDDTTFEEYDRFNCSPHEIPMSMTTLTLSVPEDDDRITCFCLGTAIIRLEETEPSEGRIVLFSAKPGTSSSNNFSLVTHAAEDVKGAVYSLAVVNDLLVAAVNSSVLVFRYEYDPMGSTLKKVTEWNHSYLVTNIASIGDHLVAADYLHSVSLLHLKEQKKLATVARDYSPLMPLAVEAFDEKSIIGADHHLNLFSFSLQQEGRRNVLKRDGFYHLGEIVTKIVRGSSRFSTAQVPSPTSPAGSIVPSERGIQPTHIYLTSSGRIGVIIDIPDNRLANDLALLEIGLGERHTEESHAKYRAPRIARGRSDADERAYGFIDGDFLEELLSLLEDSPESEAIGKILSTSLESLGRIASTKEEIKATLETLHNMH
ncbi:hypothetical protein PM082_017660 [Marasmius tenuissimus]|nr:hypothetical protein PM082_017660 [Marasmius tenuissimus]